MRHLALTVMTILLSVLAHLTFYTFAQKEFATASVGVVL